MGSVCVINLPIAAVTLMLLPFAFPGASMPLSVLISLIPAVILGGVYILFGIMLPRSGGDYVFNSRALHPAVGFAANFNFVVWNLLFAGIEGSWIATVGLSGLFGSIGGPSPATPGGRPPRSTSRRTGSRSGSARSSPTRRGECC